MRYMVQKGLKTVDQGQGMLPEHHRQQWGLLWASSSDQVVFLSSTMEQRLGKRLPKSASRYQM